MLTQQEILYMLGPVIETRGRIYRKFRPVRARKAVDGERIVTWTADGKETENTARMGDYIVENQTEAQEQYILSGEKFSRKYTPAAEPGAADDWQTYMPTGKIIALEMDAKLLQELLLPESFSFTARWGEPMIVKQGDFLAMPRDGDEVYRIARREFFETYEPDASNPQP